MSYSCDPPPYSDVIPLLPQQPEDDSQLGPSMGECPQPGGCPGGCVQSGGYPYPAGPVPPMPAVLMDEGVTAVPVVSSYVVTVTGSAEDVTRTVDWDDRRVRHAFIRKVYTILSVQLLVTMGIVSIFTFVNPVCTFVQWNITVYYSSYAVFFVSYLVLASCPGLRRRFPWNIILLSIFTLAMGFMTGTIASTYNTKAVLIAMVVIAVVAIIIAIFCFQTKVDFTSCSGLFCVLGIVIILTSIVTATVLCYKYIHWVHMVFVAIAVIVFTLFLAYDTQLLIGKTEYALSPEEYIFGALEIYVNIIYIFWFLLSLLGRR